MNPVTWPIPQKLRLSLAEDLLQGPVGRGLSPQHMTWAEKHLRDGSSHMASALARVGLHLLQHPGDYSSLDFLRTLLDDCQGQELGKPCLAHRLLTLLTFRRASLHGAHHKFAVSSVSISSLLTDCLLPSWARLLALS